MRSFATLLITGLLKTVLLITVLLLTAPAMAQDQPDRPYVFTQSHSDTTQLVLAGKRVQVQLPAGPSVWHLQPPGENAVLTGQGVYASPGRVPGTDVIQTFDFELPDLNRAVIVLRREGQGAAALPEGVFTLTLVPVLP